jgi:DNA-binding transcriptional LysR family regulator
MDIRQLRYFVAVAEERHFRRAAARLNVAQPSVSGQIKKLEAELGVQLLLRTSRSVTVTAAGVAFLEEARHVLHGFDAAAQAARRATVAGEARLRLGYSVPALPPAVTHVIGRIGRATSPIDVDLVSAPARTLLERVRRQQLDAAVVCLPAPTSGLRVLQLCRDPLVAALPGHHDAAPPLTLAEVATRRVVLPARELDPACHDAALSALHGAGAAPDVVASTAATLEQMLLEVLGGRGVALLPASAVERGGVPGVVGRPIRDAAVAVPMAMAIVAREEFAPLAIRKLFNELARAAEPPATATLAASVRAVAA